MARKSPKKLTPNQAEFGKLKKNARARYNRLLKKGYKSQYTAKDLFGAFERPERVTKQMLDKLKQELKDVTDSVLYAEAQNGTAIAFKDIPKEARRQFSTLGYTEFSSTTDTGVTINVKLSLAKGGLSTINEANLAWSNFIEANSRWVTDKKKHVGMEYVIGELRNKRHELQNRYGTNNGDTVFAYMLNEIGVVAGTLTSYEADDVTAAGRWLAGAYDYLGAGVEYMLKVNEQFGDVQA